MAALRSFNLLLLPSLLHHADCLISPSVLGARRRSLRSALLFSTDSNSNSQQSMESMSNASPKAAINGDLPPLSQNVERTLDPCVVLMKDLIGQHADLWKDKGGIFSLAQGVVYWKPPEQSIDAMKEALDDPDNNLHLYGPDEGLFKLRDELIRKVTTENGLDDHDVMVTVGANQAFVNCAITLLQESDKCVVFAPYYFNHVMALQMTLPESSLVVGPSDEADGSPDLQWLEKTLRSDPSIKVVTVVNPGNPTGTHLSRDLLQKIVDLCREHRTWLVLDCTYEYFVPSSEFDGCFSDPHVLHIFSFSKSYALAGRFICGDSTICHLLLN